jgi:hypothetical protein
MGLQMVGLVVTPAPGHRHFVRLGVWYMKFESSASLPNDWMNYGKLIDTLSQEYGLLGESLYKKSLGLNDQGIPQYTIILV